MPYSDGDSTTTTDPGTEPQIISACLNENDLNYMVDSDGTYQPNATVHDQTACQQEELYVRDENILTDNEIPDVVSPIIEKTKDVKSRLPLLALGYLLLS